MLLRFLGLALVLGWLAGCTGPNGAGIPDGGGPLYVLEALQPSVLTLAFGETADVWIVARDQEGETVSGLTVTFFLEGTFKDSGLSTVTAVTDESGLAGTTVTAGYSNALFQVRASTDDADPIFRSVAVSVGGFGSLAVTARYPGERALDSFSLTLYFESGCNDTRVVDGLPGERAIALPNGTYEGTFEPLPASSTYAVVVNALYASGTSFARGCMDAVTVAADQTLEFMLDAVDLPQTAAGEYDARLAVQVGDFAQTLGDAATAGGEAAITAASGDASFLLDAVQSSLPPAQATMFATERESGTVDDELAADLVLAGVGPAHALGIAGEALALESAAFDLDGTLVIASPETAGERLSFSAATLTFEAGLEEPFVVDLDDAGIEVVTSVASTFNALDDSATVELVFGLGSAELGRAALLAAAMRAEKPSIPSWLAEPGGCNVLVTNDAVISAANTVGCDHACLQAGCEEAFAGLLAAMEAGITEGAGRSSIGAAGTLSLEDTDGDLAVDAIDSELVCELEGGAPPLGVTGTLTATRAQAALAP